MSPRQHFGGGLIGRDSTKDDVLIAFVAGPGVAAPAIGVGNLATVEVALDEADQRAGGNIGKQTEPTPAAAAPALLHRGGGDRFLFGGPARLARPRTPRIPRRLELHHQPAAAPPQR